MIDLINFSLANACSPGIGMIQRKGSSSRPVLSTLQNHLLHLLSFNLTHKNISGLLNKKFILKTCAFLFILKPSFKETHLFFCESCSFVCKNGITDIKKKNAGLEL